MSSLINVTIDDAIVAVYDRNTHTWSPPEKSEVTLSYDTTHPFAVMLTIGGVVWTFDRVLLKTAVCMNPSRTNYGAGDVQIRRVLLDRIVVMLVAPAGNAAITLNSYLCKEFVLAVDKAVKPGTEYYNIDAWIAGLLGETA